MTPTLMTWPPGSGLVCATVSSLECARPVARRDQVTARRVGRMLAPLRAPYIGSTPHLEPSTPPFRVRRHAGAGPGQRVRPAARVATALVPARVVDLRDGRIRRRGARGRLLGGAAA